VRQRIIGIRELIEDGALAFGTHPFGDVARGFHSTGLRRQHELGAVGAHRLDALGRLAFRHD
jgi:hypothetical protein